jgi:hypothetical protein
VDGPTHERPGHRPRIRCIAAAEHGLVETSKPGLTLSWVERGADALVNRGRIGKELAAALTSEAKRRADNNAFFGYMAWASMVAQKPR